MSKEKEQEKYTPEQALADYRKAMTLLGPRIEARVRAGLYYEQAVAAEIDQIEADAKAARAAAKK